MNRCDGECSEKQEGGSKSKVSRGNGIFAAFVKSARALFTTGGKILNSKDKHKPLCLHTVARAAFTTNKFYIKVCDRPLSGLPIPIS